MSTSLVEYHNFVCRRGDKVIVTLDHLALNQGDCLGIIGPNGAGKSTLVKAFALLEPPNEGSVIYAGKPLSITSPPLSIRRQWACVFQHSQRFFGTVYQNVEIGLKLRKVPKEEIEEKVMKWLEIFQIDHLVNEQAYSLSGGEAQRMNLARAFVLEPTLLFLDEPFSALDFPTKMELISKLTEVLKETNTTSFIISHDLTDIDYLTNKLLYIEKGATIDYGNTEEVLQHPSDNLYEFLTPWRKTPPYRMLVEENN